MRTLLPPVFLLLVAMALAACTTRQPADEPAIERSDPRIVPLTVEQQRQIAE